MEVKFDFENCRYKNSCRKYLIEQSCPAQDKTIEQTCLKLSKIRGLQDAALLTEKQREPITINLEADLKDEDAYNYLEDVKNNIEKFVTNGGNLFIYSSITGNGKTHWSLKLLQSYFEAIWYKTDIKCRGMFLSVPNFLIELKSNIDQKTEQMDYIKDNLISADLIVWDDIATKGFTQYEMEQLLTIINNRLNNRKANIYTSNLSGETLKMAMGDRLYSRVFTVSDKVVFYGQDKRGVFKA